jgi:hypothetical protein
MAIHTSAESKIYIGGVATGTEDLTAYLGKSWVEIKSVETISSFGMTFNLVTFNDLSTRLVQKFKGSKNGGTVTCSAALNRDDAGQDAFRTAAAVDSDYCFRIVENDVDGGSPLAKTNIFFNGKAMSDTVEINNSDSITMTTFTIEVNSEFVVDEA